MSDDTTRDDAFPGWDAYVMGVKIVFTVLAMLIVASIVSPAVYLSQFEFVDAEALGGFTIVLLVLGLIAAAFFAVFLYVSLHHVPLVIGSSVAGSQTVVQPPPIPSAEIAGLYYLLPPAVLVYAGFQEWYRSETFGEAVTGVVIGYAIVALLTIIPVSWLFNTILSDALFNWAGVGVYVERPVYTHLVVGVIYPVLFGGLGVYIASLVGEAPIDNGESGLSK